MDFKKIKCFLLDGDGTMYLSGKVFDGVVETIQRMRKQGKVLFVTNSCLYTRKGHAKKIKKMGIPITEDEIYGAGMATIDYLKENYSGKRVFLLARNRIKKEFRANGINIVENNPEVVVTSFTNRLTFKQLSRTCAFIKNGVPFISTHHDLTYPVSKGFWPDIGATLALIEASTGKKPLAICGKPFEPLAKGICKLANCRPNEVAMFGDRLMTDIAFANKNGFVGVLVLTGEATREDASKSPHKPDVILPSLADLQI